MELPISPDDITIPKSFNYKRYCKCIEDIVIVHRPKSVSAFRNQFTRILDEHMVGRTNRSQKEVKNGVNLDLVVELLIANNQQDFQEDMNKFTLDISSKVRYVIYQ